MSTRFPNSRASAAKRALRASATLGALLLIGCPLAWSATTEVTDLLAEKSSPWTCASPWVALEDPLTACQRLPPRDPDQGGEPMVDLHLRATCTASCGDRVLLTASFEFNCETRTYGSGKFNEEWPVGPASQERYENSCAQKNPIQESEAFSHRQDDLLGEKLVFSVDPKRFKSDMEIEDCTVPIKILDNRDQACAPPVSTEVQYERSTFTATFQSTCKRTCGGTYSVRAPIEFFCDTHELWSRAEVTIDPKSAARIEGPENDRLACSEHSPHGKVSQREYFETIFEAIRGPDDKFAGPRSEEEAEDESIPTTMAFHQRPGLSAVTFSAQWDATRTKRFGGFIKLEKFPGSPEVRFSSGEDFFIQSLQGSAKRPRLLAIRLIRPSGVVGPLREQENTGIAELFEALAENGELQDSGCALSTFSSQIWLTSGIPSAQEYFRPICDPVTQKIVGARPVPAQTVLVESLPLVAPGRQAGQHEAPPASQSAAPQKQESLRHPAIPSPPQKSSHTAQ